jgi:predicted  nucleic acid-binding Zn-ribbon protein
MKNLSKFAIILTLASFQVSAQTSLPDEINYGPYQADYEDVRDERDATSNSLTEQRNLRASLLQAIDDQLLHIQNLESQIDDFNQRIGFINAELPRLVREKRDLDRSISRLQNDLRNLRADVAANNREIEIREDRVRRVKRELQQVTRDRNQQAQKTNRLQTQLENLRKDIKNLEGTVATNQTKIANLNTRIANFDKELAQKRQKLNQEKSKLNKLKGERDSLNKEIGELTDLNKTLAEKVKNERAKLKKLRDSGASQEEINKQRAIVQAAVEDLRENQNKLKALAKKKETLNKSIATTNGSIKDLETFISDAPAQLANLNKSLNELKTSNRRLTQQMKQKRQLAKTRKAELESELALLADIDKKVNRLNLRINTIENNIADFRRANRRLVTSINSMQRDLDSMVLNSNQLRDTIVSYESELPLLERNISNNRADISNTNASIAQNRASERETFREIKKLENILRVLTNQTNDAYAEYTQRYNLYNQYLSDAKDLGVSQIGPSVNSGRDFGYDMALAEGKEYGLDLASKIGLAQAKLIGSVRGELEGYKIGYDRGFSSDETIERANLIGTQKGKEQAYVYARRVFKPQYFEGFVQELIGTTKKDFSIVKTFESTKNLSHVEFELKSSEAIQVIEDLSIQELADSRALATRLDQSIENAVQNLKDTENLKVTVLNPMNVYEAPTQIPYTAYDCSGVYKGVTDFVTACENTFKTEFKKSYLFEVKAEFKAAYPTVFKDVFNTNEPVIREENFAASYDSAFQIADSDGEVDGKEDIYNITYKKAFDDSYALNMEPAKATAKTEAKSELDSWLMTKALVTVKGAEFTAKGLRGGDLATIKLTLKNLSNVEAVKSGLVKIKSSSNLEFSAKAFPLGKIAANSNGEFELQAKVNPLASSRDFISADLVFELPGDKYKEIRVESKLMNQKLDINPKAKTDLAYDPTPKIKRFRYFRHTFSASINPIVENLEAPYTISLEATPESKKYLKQYKITHQTKRLALNTVEKADFDYVFNKSADGKEVTLVLKVTYKNRVISTQNIILRPH